MTQNEFILMIRPYVISAIGKYGYPATIVNAIVAQACLESNYGKSTLASKYFNYFGMKCGSSWSGRSVNISTKEEYKAGQITNIKANFRVYDSIQEGVEGYFSFISLKRYSNLKSSITASEYITNIKNDGWATDSSYITKVLTIVKKVDNLLANTQIQSQVTNSYYPKYSGTTSSIVDALKAVGESNTTLTHRKKIAASNGITNYNGQATKNAAMLKLLKDGKLIRV